MKTKDLIAEIHKNVFDDRSRLLELHESLKAHPGLSDPELSVSIAEVSVRISDGMTRANAQLIELTKLVAKDTPEDKGIDAEKDSMFDEIDGFEREKEEENN